MAVGEEFTCTCSARYVAVRRRWWSRRLRWSRVLFAVPGEPTVRREDAPPPDRGSG